MTKFKEDQGKNFGKWKDPVSRLMYYDCMNPILEHIDIPNSVADFGGANGNLKEFIPHAITIDIDESKKPDIVADILRHKEHYELVVVRYVLHYLTDKEILHLFKSINADEILVIQFINDDLKTKYVNSKNEIKHFRTQSQLEALLPSQAKAVYRRSYEVTDEFYLNRLKIKNALPHMETIKAYLITKKIN